MVFPGKWTEYFKFARSDGINHYAAQNNTDSMAKEVSEWLLEYGFRTVAAVNNEGETALDIAAGRDNELLVKLLLMNS